MPLMSGLRKLICTLKGVPARTTSCMSEQTQVVAAHGVPPTGLVLVGLGGVAVHPLHPRGRTTEVPTVILEVDRWIDSACRQTGCLGGCDEVLSGQVGAGVLQEIPQRLRQT